MSLTDLLKSFTRVSALGLALYACGGSDDDQPGCQDDYDCRESLVCIDSVCQDFLGGQDSDIRCEPICERYWLDCNGLPQAEYWFSTSYNNCLQGCPDFLEGVNLTDYAKSMNKALDCFIKTEDCALLEKNGCGMEECDTILAYTLYRELDERPGCHDDKGNIIRP